MDETNALEQLSFIVGEVLSNYFLPPGMGSLIASDIAARIYKRGWRKPEVLRCMFAVDPFNPQQLPLAVMEENMGRSAVRAIMDRAKKIKYLPPTEDPMGIIKYVAEFSVVPSDEKGWKEVQT